MYMKPVKYFDPRRVEDNVEVLYEEDYKGVHVVIVNLGKYPTAYCTNIVKLAQASDSWDWDAENKPHGGLTFIGEAYWNKEDKNNYLGWDYGHAGDFDGYYVDEVQRDVFGEPCKMWTTEDILEDAKKFVDFLVTQPLW